MASYPSLADEKYSDREMEILHLLADGLTNKEISQKLILSLETIKWYNKGIYSKLGVNSRSQAAATARDLGLLEDEANKQPEVLPQAASRLPVQVTSFIGRQREIEEVQDLLKVSRLVTLTGPPGTGKTRLSLEVGTRAANYFSDGVIFVGLASVTTPDLVGNTIASGLGVTERLDQPVIETIKNYLKSKRILLILDNFEHVLDAALIVSDLLASSAALTILVTSREVLSLSGEHEYLVPPLATPDLASFTSLSHLSKSESVLLFAQRAKAVMSTFHLTEENGSVIANICLRLDGLPLPIELAAARIKLFSPEQLLSRLEKRLQILTSGARDVHPHQRTLRATIDWSFNLLNDREQVFFRRLGVFTEGRSIDAAEIIAKSGLDIDFIDNLESLLNKSLLFQKEGPGGTPRFFMLETIHEYAYERLSESGEYLLIRRRHLEYFIKLAEDMEPGYRGKNQLLYMDQTEAEMGNLRSAFSWAINNDDPESAARIVNATIYFLSYGNHVVEGYHWTQVAIDQIDSMSKGTQLRLLASAGRMCWVNGELAQSKHFRQKSLIMARELGDRYAEAWSLIHLAVDSISDTEGRDAAILLCEDGLSIMRDLDDKPGMAQALNNLGELLRATGDYERARLVYEECLSICFLTGELIRQSLLYTNLSFVAYREEDFQSARDLSEKSIRLWTKIGSTQGVLATLAAVAGAIGQLGEPEKAAQIIGASENLMANMGFTQHPSDIVEIELYLADIQSYLGEAGFAEARSVGESLTLDQVLDLAQTQ